MSPNLTGVLVGMLLGQALFLWVFGMRTHFNETEHIEEVEKMLKKDH